MKKILPGWSNNKLLKNCTLEPLSNSEQLFWKELIKKYLKPFEKTDEDKKNVALLLRRFRNTAVFGFLMFNSLFVLTVFLFQIKKDYLHIRWPLKVNNTIEFDETTFEIKIYRKYLEIDPIGSVLVLLFGVILVIQFFAMLIHRFGTLSQILASTELNIEFFKCVSIYVCIKN